jgi:TatD DNase family protein
VETDAPYLAPVPHRGRPNQPAYLTHVAAGLADVLGVTLADLADVTDRNAAIAFRLDAS